MPPPGGSDPGTAPPVVRVRLIARGWAIGLAVSSLILRSGLGAEELAVMGLFEVIAHLPRLLAAWGVSFNPQMVVGDLDLASTVQTQQGTSSFPTWLTLRKENLNRQFVPASDVKAMILAAGRVEHQCIGIVRFGDHVVAQPQAHFLYC